MADAIGLVSHGDMHMKRILSIDGGGIKGTLPAAFLACVEETTGKRAIDYFDLIAGTSTGGIIALGLGLGLPGREILGFYESKGPVIFGNGPIRGPRWTHPVRRLLRKKARGLRRTVHSKYNPEALRSALEGAFGERCLGESHTRLVIPAFDRQRREIHIFKTSHHERFQIDWRERAVDVALATAAAPSYLPGHRLENGISLLDGGIWANNPLGVAVVEAVAVLGWDPSSLRVLSIGCTEAPFAVPENAGVAPWANRMADVFLLGQSRGALGTAKLLLGSRDIEKRLLRYQHSAVVGEFGIDAVEQIPALKGIGAGLAREAVPQIDELFLSRRRAPFSPCYSAPA